MTDHIKLKTGLQTVKQAILVRRQITELYEQYRAMSAAAEFSAGIKHFDFKRAVDALHYLGGGWPSANSKGRMEALLDNFVGMYRVLHFIGRGHMVEDHLAQLGMTVKLDPAFAIENKEVTPSDMVFLNREYNAAALGIENAKDLRELVTQLIDTCEMLQGDICKLADTIKDGHRPAAQEALGVTDEENDRLHELVKFSMHDNAKPQKVQDKKVKAEGSIRNYHAAVGQLDVVT